MKKNSYLWRETVFQAFRENNGKTSRNRSNDKEADIFVKIWHRSGATIEPLVQVVLMCHTVSIVDVNKIKTTIVSFFSCNPTWLYFSLCLWRPVSECCFSEKEMFVEVFVSLSVQQSMVCRARRSLLDDHLNKPKLISLPSLNLNKSSELSSGCCVLTFSLSAVGARFLSVFQCWRSSCSPRTQTQCFDL